MWCDDEEVEVEVAVSCQLDTRMSTLFVFELRSASLKNSWQAPTRDQTLFRYCSRNYGTLMAGFNEGLC